MAHWKFLEDRIPPEINEMIFKATKEASFKEDRFHWKIYHKRKFDVILLQLRNHTTGIRSMEILQGISSIGRHTEGIQLIVQLIPDYIVPLLYQETYITRVWKKGYWWGYKFETIRIPDRVIVNEETGEIWGDDIGGTLQEEEVEEQEEEYYSDEEEPEL